MTLPASGGRIVANGNGVVTSWPYNFLIPATTDVVVTITEVATGVSTTLLASQYAVSGINNPAGGVVTYPLVGSPLPAGWTLTIQRIVPYEQDTDLTNQDGFYADVLENSFDYLTMQTQQLSDAVNRALLANPFGAGTVDAQNNRIINVLNGTGAQDAITKSQLDAVVVAAGNVPVPGAGNVGKWLQALTASTWGWVALVVNTADIANGAVTLAKLAQQPYATLPSAATTDLTAQTVRNVNVTGTTTITSFGTGVAGQVFDLKFTSALQITNSANILCPGNVNFLVEAGDKMQVYCQGAGVWEIRWIARMTGGPAVRRLVTIIASGSGTFNTQGWTKRMRVRMVGGGGPSGGVVATGGATYANSSGGGSGGYVEHEYTTVAASYSYAVGAAGVGASGAVGTAGGDTTFGTLTAGGGQSGNVSAAVSGSSGVVPGGAGGSASGGNIVNAVGAPGGNAVNSPGASFNFAGNGGSSAFGGGALAAQSGGITAGTAPGTPASGYGGGGSGGNSSISTGARTGGNGTIGVIVIEEWP